MNLIKYNKKKGKWPIAWTNPRIIENIKAKM
jgi:hypothetical protein